MDFGLWGRKALVTAGANGIGEGAAVKLAEAGADVAIIDIDAGNAHRVADRVRAFGRTAVVVEANALDRTDFSAGVTRAVEEMGGVDILINNVGGVKPRPFTSQTPANWERIIDLNLVSMVSATKVAAAAMIDAGVHGAIVNVASSEALRAAPAYSIYAACKAGMVSFTKTMAVELAEHGIRVNCIAPDAIDTPGIRPPEIAPGLPGHMVVAHVPMRRLGSIEEAGNTIAFLASELASFVTGATLSVDGGIAAASGWLRQPDNSWALS